MRNNKKKKSGHGSVVVLVRRQSRGFWIQESGCSFSRTGTNLALKDVVVSGRVLLAEEAVPLAVGGMKIPIFLYSALDLSLMEVFMCNLNVLI